MCLGCGRTLAHKKRHKDYFPWQFGPLSDSELCVPLVWASYPERSQAIVSMRVAAYNDAVPTVPLNVDFQVSGPLYAYHSRGSSTLSSAYYVSTILLPTNLWPQTSHCLVGRSLDRLCRMETTTFHRVAMGIKLAGQSPERDGPSQPR